MTKRVAVSIRPVMPRMAMAVQEAAPAPASMTPTIPGPPVGPQINDTVVSPGSVWSSARTEQAIDQAVAEQVYDFDALVAATLSI